MSGILDLNSSFHSNMGDCSMSSMTSFPLDEEIANWSINSNNCKMGNYGNEFDEAPISPRPTNGSGGIQRSASYGAGDNRNPVLPVLQRFIGGNSLEFKSRNPIRLKKNASADEARIQESRSLSLSGEKSSISPSGKEPTSPRKELPSTPISEHEVLDQCYADYLGIFILGQIAVKQEEELLNELSDRSMNLLEPLWIDTVPNQQFDILNQDIIEKVTDLKSIALAEKKLDFVLAKIEEGFEQKRDKILDVLDKKSNTLRVRNLKLRSPVDMSSLILCLTQFREFFLSDQSSALKVISTILTAERELDETKDAALRFSEEEIPYHNLLKILISLGLSLITVDKYRHRHEDRLSISAFEGSGIFSSSTPKSFSESKYLSFADMETRLYESYTEDQVI